MLSLANRSVPDQLIIGDVLSLPSGLQGDLDLNICEAHAFTTTDKFSLDVFVVNGWQGEVRGHG